MKNISENFSHNSFYLCRYLFILTQTGDWWFLLYFRISVLQFTFINLNCLCSYVYDFSPSICACITSLFLCTRLKQFCFIMKGKFIETRQRAMKTHLYLFWTPRTMFTDALAIQNCKWFYYKMFLLILIKITKTYSWIANVQIPSWKA